MFERTIMVLKIIIWPALVGFGIFLFRKPIYNFISRSTRARFPGGFELSVNKNNRVKPDDHSQKIDEKILNWDKSGDLYWLGSDLAVTYYMLGFAEKEAVTRCLDRCLWRARSLGFEQTSIVSWLESIKVEVKNEKMTFLGFIPESIRKKQQEQIKKIVDQIGELAEGNQPDFKVPPENRD